MIDILTIQLRRDTAANWTSLNPVLRQGEVGIETDTSNAKLGDGATAWASLGYWAPGAQGSLFYRVAPVVVNLTDAATVAVNAQLGNDFRLLLTATGHTIGNPANPDDGQDISFLITQPASGGPYLVNWGSAYGFGSAGVPTLSTSASASDLLAFKYVAFKSKWIYMGIATGN